MESENKTSRESILSDALQAVSKDRCATHGQPEDTFQVIADFWTTYLYHRNLLPVGDKIESWDVAAMMDLMKTGRITQNPNHPDHWTDKAGYSACGGEIACNK